MSLQFACPSCKAYMEVADELAGHSGQCPRCQHVFVVPSPALGAPKPVVVAKAIPATATIPPTDPWAEEQPKPRPRGERPRRVRSVPPAPSGPLWPWLIAVPLALVVAVLLFSSFIVLVAWRKPATIPPGVALQELPVFKKQPDRAIIGRLDGNRAFMEGGVFQVREKLTNTDPLDLDDARCRAKRFDVELIANRTYLIDIDSNDFDPVVSIDELNNPIDRQGNRGNRNAQIVFMPRRTAVFTIYASSVDPAFGPFTLTVREQNVAKPFVP
jgi:hypothetical protein